MTKLTQQVVVNDLEDLNQLAKQLASNLKGGETIELVSDLGGGKTALVRYLVAHLNSPDTVSSPSFTIENIYGGDKFNIHHFDFYRLDQAGICGLELEEALADPAVLTIIEWSAIVNNLLPDNRLTITIEPQPSEAFPNCRLFKFSLHSADLAYLIKDL